MEAIVVKNMIVQSMLFTKSFADQFRRIYHKKSIFLTFHYLKCLPILNEYVTINMAIWCALQSVIGGSQKLSKVSPALKNFNTYSSSGSILKSVWLRYAPISNKTSKFFLGSKARQFIRRRGWEIWGPCTLYPSLEEKKQSRLSAKKYCSFHRLHDWRECFKRAIVMIKVAVHTIHSTSFSQLISRGRSQFFFVAAGFVHLTRLPSSWSISWKTSVRSLSTS